MARLKAHGEELARFRHPDGSEFVFMEDLAVLRKDKGETWRLFKARHEMARVGSAAALARWIKERGYEQVSGQVVRT